MASERSRNGGKMANKKVKMLTINAMFLAVIVIFGLTPVGYIKIPPVEMTLIALPVIISALTMGVKSSLLCGLFFGITSLLQVFIAPSALSALFYVDVLKMLIVIFIPRLLVPLCALGVKKIFKNVKSKKGVFAVNAAASIAGSLANTVFFLGLTYLLFLPNVAEIFAVSEGAVAGMLASVALINGGAEALLSAVVCPAVAIAINSIYKEK